MKTKVIVSLCALCLALSAAPAIFADETWQGNAAVSLKGELDRNGYYAASNSFPPGTKILVTNLDNGRRVIVTVKQRLDGSANVFLLLSSNAAGELGMQPTDVIRIKSQVVGISTDLTGGIDLAQNRDMETNPSVGAPDLNRTTPNALVETSPQPSATPLPSPTPSATPSVSPTPTPALTETRQGPEFEKDRFSRPSAGQEGELSARTEAPPAAADTLGGVKLAEARVALKERGQAVILSRPSAGSESGQGEVVAILIEPKAVAKPDRTPKLTDLERPALPDRETIELALNDPTLREKEKPFIYERHGLKPAGEELALASQDLPEVGHREKAEVDDYMKAAQEADRLALETHDLPEVQQAEKADVTGLAKVESEKDRLALETYNLPEVQQGEKGDVTALVKTEPAREKTVTKNLLPNVQGPEKPDLMTRTEPSGKDKKSVDLALVPTNPNPPKKRMETRTVVTTQPDHTTQTTTVEPDKNTTVTTTVWDNTAAYSKNYYYLQLGVFTTREAAEKILRAYPTYPMAIVSGKADNANVFKVVVGPLKRDETGTVLYLFKARGYRDAFLRYIE
ncbi:MAG: hypothetical protein JXD23_06150 [Spirochaetales bacterium]|nr:hypothetical protein [Spirochaetales bacterium]